MKSLNLFYKSQKPRHISAIKKSTVITSKQEPDVGEKNEKLRFDNLIITKRMRKSPFVRLFNKTPSNVICPHFYELILSNGCPFNCLYCYLKLTFRGNKNPVIFTNPWSQVEKELLKISKGVFSTGELADSLAVIPDLLEPAILWFSNQEGRYLLLTTKSTNINFLRKFTPSSQVIVSFSINSLKAWELFEKKTPSPLKRLESAEKLKALGWRVRIRLDPVCLEVGLKDYEDICKRIKDLDPEVVTVGTLRHYPGLFRFEKQAPRKGLKKAPDGRMRYAEEERLKAYETIANWLGREPALCKETREVWEKLGWKFRVCNCTVIENGK